MFDIENIDGKACHELYNNINTDTLIYFKDYTAIWNLYGNKSKFGYVSKFSVKNYKILNKNNEIQIIFKPNLYICISCNNSSILTYNDEKYIIFKSKDVFNNIKYGSGPIFRIIKLELSDEDYKKLLMFLTI